MDANTFIDWTSTVGRSEEIGGVWNFGPSILLTCEPHPNEHSTTGTFSWPTCLPECEASCRNSELNFPRFYLHFISTIQHIFAAYKTPLNDPNRCNRCFQCFQPFEPSFDAFQHRGPRTSLWTRGLRGLECDVSAVGIWWNDRWMILEMLVVLTTSASSLKFIPHVSFRTKALVDYMKHAAFFMLDQRLVDVKVS